MRHSSCLTASPIQSRLRVAWARGSDGSWKCDKFAQASWRRVFCHCIKDRLEHEALQIGFKIGVQAEPIAGLPRRKDEPERETGKVPLLLQVQTEAIGRLMRGAEVAAPN